MAKLSKPVPQTQFSLPTPSRQLSIAFDSVTLRGLLPTERAKIVAHLASVLLQAAGAVEEEHDDDGH